MKQHGLIILIAAIILVGLLLISQMNDLNFDNTKDNQTDYQDTSDNADNNNYQSSSNSSENSKPTVSEDTSSKKVEKTNNAKYYCSYKIHQ